METNAQATDIDREVDDDMFDCRFRTVNTGTLSRILPLAVAVAVDPDVEITRCAQLLEVIHRLGANRDLIGQIGRLAMGQIPEALIGAIVKAIIVGIIGRRQEVVDPILVRPQISFGFAAHPLPQVEGAWVAMQRAFG